MMLDCTTLAMGNPTLADIESVLGPYMQDLFRHAVRFKEPLAVTTPADSIKARIRVTPSRCLGRKLPVPPYI